MVNSIDLDEIKALAKQPVRLAALSDLSAALIFATSAWYIYRYNWTVSGQEPTDTEWNEIQRTIGTMEFELMNPLVGLILPHALASLATMPLLPCDGSQYLRVDYPLLYAALDPVYQVDADNFRVPDMMEKFPLGASVNFGLDDTGGEIEHILTIGELATHSHGNDPHSHSEITAIAAVSQLVVLPQPSAIPAVGVTGAATVNIHNTGGGEAHNNMPPYRVLRWAIVAG